MHVQMLIWSTCSFPIKPFKVLQNNIKYSSACVTLSTVMIHVISKWHAFTNSSQQLRSFLGSIPFSTTGDETVVHTRHWSAINPENLLAILQGILPIS